MLELAAVAGPRFELRLLAEAAARRPRRSRHVGRGGGRDRDARGAARPGARVPVHARARAPRDLRRHPACSSSRAAPARRRGARRHLRRRSQPLSCPSSPITSRSLPRSRASSVVSSTTSAPPRRDRDLGLRRGGGAALERARARDRRPTRARARAGRARPPPLPHRALGESDAILSASLDAATSLEERGLAMRVLVHRTNERLASDPDVGSAEIVPIAEEAIRTFEQLGDPLGLAAAENLLGHALGREGRTEEAFAAYGRALAHAEAAGDQVTRRDIIGHIATRLCDGATPVGEAIQTARRAPTLEQRRPRARCRAVPLPRPAARDGRPLRRGARAHPGERTGPRHGRPVEALTLNSRWLVAEAKELAGDAAGARQDVLAAFLSMRDRRGEGSEARALRAAARSLFSAATRATGTRRPSTSRTVERVDQIRTAPGQGLRHPAPCRQGSGRRAARRDRGSARTRRACGRACRAERLAQLPSLGLARARRGAAGERPDDRRRRRRRGGASPLRGEGERRRHRSPPSRCG